MDGPTVVEGSSVDQMPNGLPDDGGEPVVNGHGSGGLSNGSALENHVKKESSEKKSSDHKSSSSSDRHKSSSSSDKHKSSSSSHKHKSSHSDKHRDGSHKSSSSSHKHSSSSDKDKHRSSSSHKHSSSSSSGDKHRSSSSHSSSKDGKHHSSSSSSKHSSSHKSSSSSSKHSSSSSSKDKHSSSSSKHHSSSSGDKHKSDKDKHKSSSSSSDKHKSDKDKIKKEVKTEVKTEVETNHVDVKPEPMSPKKSPTKVKQEVESDDDMPLSARKDAMAEKRSAELSDDDDQPLSARMQKAKKIKTEDTPIKTEVKKRKSLEEDEDFTPSAKKKKKDDKKKKKVEKAEPVTSPKKGKVKKEEEGQEKWKWWEEQDEKEEGVKWKFLEHKGVLFAPEYERLPKSVRFYYDGQPMELTEETEEVAGFYAKMLNHDYTTREVFNRNFFKDWRKVMTHEEKAAITDLSKCNFKEMLQYFTQKSEERKAMSKEEKKKIKEQNEEIVKEYGYCTIDGHTERVGNFRIEPPGLFRGRGDHPKQGMLKKRVVAENIIINCSKDSVAPKPPPGHRWKEVRHDPTVTWLASWTENVQNQTKYVMLAATSKLKGQKDMEKYEVARKLHQHVDKIRATYKDDWKSKEMRIRQRAVALYFIDKLALRAGNEKDGEETADTVGCCSLRFEHIKLHEEKDGKEYVVEFDFLGKDSIRYHNEVGVEKRVFKNLQLFMENKKPGDDLFDRLNTAVMNKHLNSLMDGLTAKVFRTYNASRTLQEQLDLLTITDDPVAAKILTYNRANRAVAVLCNHQRAVSKNFGKQMENMQTKINAKKDAIHAAKKDLKAAKSDYKALKTENKRKIVERKKKAVERLEEQLTKLEISMTDKDENKDIALGTSKLNYLDPRISAAWCKKWEVPVEKVYNKTQREKFAWAIEMAESDYKFTELED